MKRILLIIFFFSMISALSVHAQVQTGFGFMYSINFPTGNTKNFIEKTSFRGATFEYRKYVKPNISIGFVSGWYTFYEKKGYGSYTTQDDATTYAGVQYRYLNTTPLLITGHYYFNLEGMIVPFAGLGIGTTYNRVDVQMGLYNIETTTWQFTLAPEAGVKFAAGNDKGIWGFLSARYNNNFSNSELDTQGYVTLSVGLLAEL